MDNKESQRIKSNIPLVAVDTVVFTVIENKLSVLLIHIKDGTYDDMWAIPGGLVKEQEPLEAAAVRVLSEKTNLKDIYIEQLYTFGDPDRDNRGRSISVAYFSLISSPEHLVIKTLDYYREIKWFDAEKLPKMAFDHKKIIEKAKERLRGKLSYSNIAYSLLPEVFTLYQLQNIYEVILGRKLDKRNFRKKIDSLNILEDLKVKQSDVTHRPASLYKFKKRKLELF